MSKSKRAKARRRQQAASLKAADRAAVVGEPQESRHAPVRRRVRAAKLGIGAAAVVGVCASMGLARVTYAGHSKHVIKTLAIPKPMYEVVRRNLLAAGILAPATAPPDAATSTS
jgi:hypothetical protein